jgi:hypothetical protein
MALTSGLMVVALASSPAYAAKTCLSAKDEGKRRAIVGNIRAAWVIKQSDRRENFSGGARLLEFRSETSKTETNTVAGYAEGSVEAGIAWAKVQGKVGGSIEDVGSKTTFSAFKETKRLKTGNIYIYARGARKYSTAVTFQRCEWGHPTRRGWRTYDTTRATGWDKADTWVRCAKSNPPAGSFSKWVKRFKC